VLAIEATEAGLRYNAFPAGRTEVAFPLVAVESDQAEFANPEHDAPKTIRYRRSGDVLEARVDGGAPAEDFRWQLGAPGRAEALEAADLAFAADVAARGVDGWAAAFDDAGAMWSRRQKRRIEGAGIRDVMAPLFSRGMQIEWTPVASGLSPAGDLGYTIGTSRFTEPGAGGSRVEAARGSYVTIWRRQGDGSWKVVFDTGN
jgi:ketosteroid isomerase-like protein